MDHFRLRQMTTSAYIQELTVSQQVDYPGLRLQTASVCGSCTPLFNVTPYPADHGLSPWDRSADHHGLRLTLGHLLPPLSANSGVIAGFEHVERL